MDGQEVVRRTAVARRLPAGEIIENPITSNFREGLTLLQYFVSTLEAKNAGLVKFHNVTTVKDKKGDLVVMNRSGALIIHDQKAREKEHHAVVYGARLKVRDGGDVKQGQLMVEWNPYSFTIMTEEDGQAVFKDVLDGQTVHATPIRFQRDRAGFRICFDPDPSLCTMLLT